MALLFFTVGVERQQPNWFSGDFVRKMSQPDLPQPEREQDQRAEQRGGAGQNTHTCVVNVRSDALKNVVDVFVAANMMFHVPAKPEEPAESGPVQL